MKKGLLYSISDFDFMLKHFILFFLILFSTVPAKCKASGSNSTQKNSIQQQLTTATGIQKVEFLLKLSSLYSDSIGKALALNQAAIAEAYHLHDNYWLARAFTKMAALRMQSGSSKDSIIICLNIAEKAYIESGTNQFDPDYYSTKARYYFEIKDFAQSASFSRTAIELSKKKNDMLAMARSYIVLAKISLKKGELKEFVEYLRMAEKELLLCDDKTSSGRYLISVGLLYNDAGMNDLAQKVLIKATRICAQNSDSLYMAYLYCNISGIFKSDAHNDQTQLLLEKAVTIFTKLKNEKGLGYAQNILGMHSMDHKNYSEALLWFAKTIRCKTNIGDWQGACFAACNTLDVYMALKKYESILPWLAEAEKYMQSAGDPLSAIVFFNTKARFQVLDKNFAEALANFNTSLKLSTESNNNVFLLENLKSMAELYQLNGEESKALQYFQKYVEAGDSVRNAANPLQQEELINELNANRLIDIALEKKRETRQFQTRYFSLLGVSVAFILLIVLSTRFFGSKHVYQLHNTDLEAMKISTNGIEIVQEKPQKVFISEEMQQNIWISLQQKMKAEKYFLRSDLSLHELAELLQTNTSYLSKVINELTGQNFNSFLNQYRIEEACNQLLNPKHQFLSIEGIALSVGFNSKSAFNTAFKKIKGLTPTEFIEQQRAIVH